MDISATLWVAVGEDRGIETKRVRKFLIHLFCICANPVSRFFFFLRILNSSPYFYSAFFYSFKVDFHRTAWMCMCVCVRVCICILYTKKIITTGLVLPLIFFYSFFSRIRRMYFLRNGTLTFTYEQSPLYLYHNKTIKYIYLYR